MSGLGLVLSIAKDALSAQRYGMDVTAHNIANVNTEGYSRQRPVYEARRPAPYGGLLLGQGVDTSEVMRISDQFIENRLAQQNSSMLSFREMESYMQVLGGVFSENSERSISALLADFWNTWHDVANNPSGTSERIALYEHSVSLSEQFNALYTDLTGLEIDLTNSVSAGIDKINEITAEIARINNEIVGVEVDKIANDLRDKRNMLVSELSGYLDVKGFEQSNGSLTVITAKGCVLVSGNDSYDLELGGDDGKRVLCQGSGGITTDITDYITNGKLGGWLDIRDEVIAKYKLDLDALAKEFIWAVNQQHSQGVGLEAFSSATGTYGVSNILEELGMEDSGLDYQEKISTGGFNIWVYDSNGAVVGGLPTAISVSDVEPGGTTLVDIRNAINAIANISANITPDGKLQIDADPGYTFAFSDDTSNVLAAIGINTFFAGASAGNIGVNDVIGSDKNCIATAQVDNDPVSPGYGTYATGDNTNALSMTDLQYTPIDIAQWACDRRSGNIQGTVNATIEEYYHAMVGSIGIKSSSISRGLSFSEVMVSKLGEIRDSISAVSLDEEMTNLIKFQHAYTAAAKLISVADEMLDTLLSTK
jgi:flagellar hook-associated protein 1 FlgK